ncbi:hypothetical protein ACQ4PT_050013 [Festuca glaucescens]
MELLSTTGKTTAVIPFGEASIFRMGVFVDAVVPALKAENLRGVLDMYICVCRALEYMENSEVCSSSDDRTVMISSLSTLVDTLSKAISSTTEKVMTVIEEDDSWAIEILQGRGEVHRNTRWIVDCIMSAFAEAHTSARDISGLTDVIDDTVRQLKDLLLRKSELCSDPSLRYLFLLNNSYFVAQLEETRLPPHYWKLTPELELSKKYMYTYLDVSWGHVLSCIPRPHFPAGLRRWVSASKLAKFEFWKVPDPQLRDVLRRAITDRVVSGHRDYLNDHPELAEDVYLRNSTPEVVEEMFVTAI